VIYEHVAPNPIGTGHRIGAVVGEFFGVKSMPPADDPSSSSCKVANEVRWSALYPGMITVNCDGAWDPGTKMAGAGVTVRNKDGQVVSGSSSPSFF
jgi:hypothetical protein